MSVVISGPLCTPTNSKGKGNCDESVVPPHVGMVFHSLEEAEEYYRKYAKQQGFGIIKPSSGYNRKKNGEARKYEVRNVTWRCECAGKPDLRKRSKKKVTEEGDDVVMLPAGPVRHSKKVECKALMYVSIDESGSWVVRKVCLEHSGHVPTPSKSRYIFQHRKSEMTNLVKRKLFTSLDAGLTIPQVCNTMAVERNGVDQVLVTDRDMRNVVALEKKLKLEEGDANAMMKYFSKMQSDNANFFHSFRLDEDGRLQDVIWVDARCRAAYEEFGDVVCFDTTYLTNEYDLPFANFVGINHHGQTILLGCALVSRETTETFEWVFKEWLACMGGKAPDGILTDQAAAIHAALGNVMPTARHRWCLWHIMQKFPKYLSKLGGYDEFSYKLREIIYDSLSGEEFERRWNVVIEEYQLEDNDWLSDLYNKRDMWVPAYSKDIFWAGMKSTQRVESIHSFFDAFFGKHTTLADFASQYCHSMEKRAAEERREDVKSARCLRRLTTIFMVERVFNEVYTNAIFDKVQEECDAVIYCNCRKETKVGENLYEHVIQDRVKTKRKGRKPSFIRGYNRRRNYKVIFDSSTNEVTCECKMFETDGIMCRHTIRVLDLHDVNDLPEKYILRRWRKDVRRKHSMVKVAYHDPSKTVEVRRYDKMMLMFEEMASKAMESDEAMGTVMDGLSAMNNELNSRIGNKSASNSLTAEDGIGMSNNVVTHGEDGLGTPESVGTLKKVKDPVKRKRGAGKPRSKRISSPFEPGGSWKLTKPKQKQGDVSHQVITRGRKRRMIEKGDSSFDDTFNSVVPCTPSHSQDPYDVEEPRFDLDTLSQSRVGFTELLQSFTPK